MLSTTRKRGRQVYGFVDAARVILLAFFMLAGAAGPALAQETITFEAQRHENYGRLILTFPDRMKLPEHAVTSDNGVLVIAVPDTPMAGVLPDIGTTLGEYLAVARFDPDRTGIRMGMREQFQINTMAAGEQLYIDLLPTDWVGLPPALPPEIITKLPNAPKRRPGLPRSAGGPNWCSNTTPNPRSGWASTRPSHASSLPGTWEPRPSSPAKANKPRSGSTGRCPSIFTKCFRTAPHSWAR